ncbi:MAG: hypothetical protein EXQ69_08585 [Acidimicrobiia bacterium]|nr:hypothetical protein [Acidimicrobiia bacterium]
MKATALIAGVNKAGTTSLFVSLSEHPDVAQSSVKETRFFQPARYGKPVPPSTEWEAYFSVSPNTVRLEATPSYFYGGRKVATAILERIEQPRVILLFREPVARALSFFDYQKVRLRFASDMTLDRYLTEADRLGAADFDDPDNEKYMAVRGGRYADWLGEWWDVLGQSNVKVVFFENLVANQATALTDIAQWLELDPHRFPHDALRSENLTTGYKNKRMQQLALAGNDRFEKLLRRVPTVKRTLRSAYFKLNGRPMRAEVTDAMREDLASRFEEPNKRLRYQLTNANLALPPWLT